MTSTDPQLAETIPATNTVQMQAEPMTEESPEPIRVAVEAALSRKAEDVKVLELREVSDFTDLFLLCNGTNDRQVQAIADAITDELRKAGVRPLSVEGYRHARWVLIDYGDLVVHVFLDECRGFYDLERLWADAPNRTAEFVA